jgi:hypothetical protein
MIRLSHPGCSSQELSGFCNCIETLQWSCVLLTALPTSPPTALETCSRDLGRSNGLESMRPGLQAMASNCPKQDHGRTSRFRCIDNCSHYSHPRCQQLGQQQKQTWPIGCVTHDDALLRTHMTPVWSNSGTGTVPEGTLVLSRMTPTSHMGRCPKTAYFYLLGKYPSNFPFLSSTSSLFASSHKCLFSKPSTHHL